MYTDGSKSEKGVGVAFCVWSEQNIVNSRLAKLQDYNTVFQAKLLALKHATDQPITILVDNQASAQAAATLEVETKHLERSIRALSRIRIYTFLVSKITWATTETRRRKD
ncbi:hypothetical protein AVEN_268157-1 [Araneus ventricosus]|uniref:RNase H type-1 domain-containing protein n=1 Tax=Araneus ventricosus TaxID=182803 RepID=A0A4Y2LY60_ARAVE|nr:hypothetical protein AVEN_268157-1 [Araneus ventricosus]